LKPICFFNSSKSWGGGERWVFESSTRAALEDREVHVVVNTSSVLGDRLASIPNINIHRFPISNLSFMNPVLMMKLVEFYKKNSIASVLFSLPSDVKAGGIAARWAKVKRIVYRRGIALPVRNTALNRWLFKSIITRFICNSEETRRLALKENPELIEPERTTIIYNGFKLDAYDAQSAAPLYERKTGEFVLGNSGRLTRQKGQKLAIDAVKMLVDKGHPVKMLIAGTGELEAELKEHARRIGVEDRVEFLGFVESMRGFYESIDMLVHTALWEGFGYVLVEAMSSRKPVVAFHVSSNPEVIDDEGTGLLAKSEDIDALVGKIERLIASPELQNEYGNNGRKRVVAEFDSERAYQKLMAVLD